MIFLAHDEPCVSILHEHEENKRHCHRTRPDSRMNSSKRLSDPSRLSQGLRIEMMSVADVAQVQSSAWARLALERSEAAPFTDPAWIGTYDSVCAQERLVVAAAWENDQLVGLAPLHQQIPAKRFVSPTFDWLNRFEFLAESSRRDVLDAFWRCWFGKTGCDVIHMELVPESSPTLASALTVASERGWRVTVEQTCLSPWRPLPATQDGWDTGLKSKFKANLRNREQRLANTGSVRFEVVRGPERLTAAMNVFYELEASGWKGQEQTSIRQRPDVRMFYDTLVARAPQDFWVPILYADDKPIAAQFIRVCGDVAYLLKVGFDPEFSPYSPGQLLMARVMAYSIAQGCTVFDFLGEQMTWKMDWNPLLRTLCRVQLFAPSLAGQTAYWSKVGYRDLLKKIPGLNSLVRRLRKLPVGD